MPYLFTCPHCQTRTMVDDQYCGQSGRCVTCDRPIQIPDFGAGGPQAKIRRARPLAWLVASAVAITIAVSLVVLLVKQGGQTISQLQTSRIRVSSMRNLQKIAAAMNQYAADYGRYPEPFTSDDQGNVLHSWRVSLLPYLGEDELFKRFRLEVPWDHPDNLAIAYEKMPDVYLHPDGASQLMSGEPAYFLVTGKGTLFPKGRALGPGDVTDAPWQTILVIEGTPSVASGVWIQPIDLDFAQMQGNLNSPGGNEPGGWLQGGVASATVDGRSHFIPDSIAPIIFRSLVTPQGGEQLADDTLN